MADKKTEQKSQSSTKPSSSTAKPAAKSTPNAKPEATVKPATKSAPAAKPAATAPKTTAKPATAPKAEVKPATTAKPATKTAPAAKPAATAPKTAVKPATNSKPTATVKPASAAKPADKTAPNPTAKPAAEKPAAKKVAAERTEPKAKEPLQKGDKPAKKNENSAKKGGAVAMTKNQKIRIIVIAATAFVLILALVLGITLGVKACNKTPGGNGALTIPVPSDGNYAASGELKPGDEYEAITTGSEFYFPKNEIDTYEYDAGFKTNTQVGYSSRMIGTVERNIPQKTRDEGLGAYPKYGYTLSTVVGAGDDKTAMRQALIEESDYFCAQGTRNNSGNGNNGDGTFTWMDKDGNLFRGTTAEPVPATDDSGLQRKLYKHSASVGMYYGGINAANPELSNDEPGIIKEVSIRPRGYGSYSVTGVYAPAGEVIKIRISEADMNATGGLTIHIGQALYNGQSNNIWAAKGQMQRFPNILNTMNVNKNTAVLGEDGYYTAYVGSFLGGPIYIRNTVASFTATISGGVAYSHFILGVTTKEEFEQNKNTTVPYFDLEVWHNGVLHSGPKYFAQKYSYEDLYNAAVFWDKVASVTTTNSNQGIVFLYDPFVAAGAAVAFPGRSSVNCPAGWMDGSLNYNGMVTNGSWGNLHEYHHNFQGYGVGNGGEVTNNGMTLVSYAEFTKISSKRGISSYGGQGLGGWNNYTSATWALNDLLSIQRGGSPSNGNQGLAIYATLLHNFGSDNYIQAKVKQQKGGYGQTYSGYMKAWEEQTHNDMSYFFTDVLKGLTADAAAETHNSAYTSKFVPVSSVYQTGRSYMYDGVKKYFKTMQPYVVPFENSFMLDLNKYNAPDGQYESGSIVLPDGLDFTVKSVMPVNGKGTVTKTADNIYNYTFANATDKLSDEIKVTLEIKKDNQKFADDVEIIIQLERSYETNKMTLERTVYTYADAAMYSDAVAAYEANFAGYTNKTEKVHTNPTQNANTDIWLVSPGFESRFPNATEDQMLANNNNTVHVIDGKLYFENEGKYRIYLRGRKNCAVYYSLDGGQTYELGAKVTNGSGDKFYLNNPETYFDLDLEENSWVYVKEVLIVKSADSSYIGLGYGAWTKPMFTMVEKYYDASGKEVASPEAEGYHHTETHYYDYQGHEVTEEQANSAELIAPNGATYINAYKCNYKLPDNSKFNTDYFYKRKYNYNYTDNRLLGTAEKNVAGASGMSLSTSWGAGYDSLSVILDGDRTSGGVKQLHSNKAPSEAAPFTFTIDLGEVCTANRFVFYSQGGRADPQFPKDMKLYSSTDGENFTLIGSYTDLTHSGSTLIINFAETEMRYYKFEITKSTGNYIIMREVEMWKVFEINGNGENVINPTSDNVTLSSGWKSMVSASTFGHLLLGKSGDKINFTFTGTRLAVLTSEAYGKNFEVYIDSVKVSSIDVKNHGGAFGITYLSERLSSGTHNVEIRCTGEANIDSFAVYDETPATE